MRRTARALSVAALAGVVLGFVASAAFAEPTAEVSPGSVAPGGSVTVSVSCDALGSTAPATIDATSQAFEEGTVQLKRVSGNDEKAAGPAYSGTARIPPAENFEDDPDAAGPDSAWTVDGACPAAPGGEGKEWSATLTVALDSGGGKGGTGGEGKGSSTDGATQGAGEGGEGGKDGTESGGEGGKGGTEGGWGGADGGGDPCTEPRSGDTEPGKAGSGWEEAAPSGKGDHSGSHAQDCDSAAVDHGVRAGDGGTFTDSVPALVAGGVLIAGAAGGAVYRLRRRTPTAQD
ncbi:hypothetical protein ACFQ6E_02825 [Streptomyces sp. NPDC056462]|uniref:hypothetical protein n=1 Tax=Streptomyces sp. NPDC056462 TaxID=3345826 RepID=UPI00367A5F2B